VLILFVSLGLLLQQPQTLSMLETPLYAPSFPRDVRSRLETDLASAKAALAKDPKNADAGLAYARAQEALGYIGDALETLARAIEAKPEDGRLFLERAHALIVYRKFEAAERDARKALETMPDATCTLGLALYLRGDFSRSREAYSKCQTPGIFAYLADRRAGGHAVSPPDTSTISEEPPAADPRLPGSTLPLAKPKPTMTAAYVEAADKIAAGPSPRRGHTHPAENQLKEIVEKNENRWMEPIYIAAEADYARILKAEGKFKKAGRKK
jgi:tetratricopeptide (TPR) repeat protein